MGDKTVKVSAEEFGKLTGGAGAEPPKDKVVHVHNWYHRQGGESVEPAPRGIQFGTIMALIAGFMAGFIVALMFIGR